MTFLNLLKKGNVIIWDGGFGTTITNRLNKTFHLSLEELNLKNPELVLAVHRSFLESGAQVIKTNTFGADRITLSEHGLKDRVREINQAAVAIAKKALTNRSPATGHWPFFLSASIGPTTKLPTLGHISFDDLVIAYKEQVKILVDAGVDLLQIETCQDILQAKAAIFASAEVMKYKSPSPLPSPPRGEGKFPIIVTITIEKNGVTTLGTEIGAALAALEPLGITAFGLNCATGPIEMEEQIRYLADYSNLPIAIFPNAGLPEIRGGKTIYPLSPKEFADWIEYFVKKMGVQIVGGCCGTTPDHIAEISKRVKGYTLRPKKKRKIHLLSSLYSPVSIEQISRPLIIGERMNINGSKEFKELLLAERYDDAALMAKKQSEQGAHILDFSVAYAGRDEKADIDQMTKRLSRLSPLPIMIDSTDPVAIETALKNLGGRSVINSINLEDGGAKAEKILKLAQRYGAAVVGLTIDEKGMALTSSKKISIAKRLTSLCKRFDVTLFIDFLTFTLLEPKAALFGNGKETLSALKKFSRSKQVSNIYTILGISNISYGAKKEGRKILNSVFLNEATKAGLDAAIVHAGQILPLHTLDKQALKVAKDLILCRKKDALDNFMSFFKKRERPPSKFHSQVKRDGNDERLANCIITGDSTDLSELIRVALKKMPAQEIINKIMLPSMQKVGKLFGDRSFPLPLVLQSAEVMKKGMDLLSGHLEKHSSVIKGTIILATVKSDVHDIGKNLVDIILSNNGFKVKNLGVKQSISGIIAAVKKFRPDAIGLSGLTVQSCIIIKEYLEELSRRKIKVPVICGGAALTKKFVKRDLEKAYGQKVHYARDAFDGLKIMNEICKR